MFVLGDTITPLLAANFIYLFFLNAVIGVIEGKLLKRWFHGGRRAVWWMIPANYLSAWIGWLGVDWVLVSGGIEHYLGPRPIERINGLALLLVLVSFAVTLVLESGFVLVATERARRSFAQTVLASLSVNACSYLIICALFLCLSFTLPFNARITRLGNMAPLPPGTLYWVNPEGCVMVAASDHAGPQHRQGDEKRAFQSVLASNRAGRPSGSRPTNGCIQHACVFEPARASRPGPSRISRRRSGFRVSERLLGSVAGSVNERAGPEGA